MGWKSQKRLKSPVINKQQQQPYLIIEILVVGIAVENLKLNVEVIPKEIDVGKLKRNVKSIHKAEEIYK